MNYPEGKAIDILLVEDNEGDIRLALEAFKKSKIRNKIHLVKDGMEATEFLERHEPYEQAPRPDLIMLDLNLPRKDGRQLLEEIKTHPDLRRIPVIILTTSQAEEDIIRSYNNHANCYITKIFDMNQFFKVIASIEDFWLSVVKLPKEKERTP